MKDRAIQKGSAYRPQANFLPLAPKRGRVETLPIKPSRRYEEELRLKKEKEVSVASEGINTNEAPVVVAL
jgi:hypothetical protein